MDRDEFLAVRMQGIGGSDCAAAIGLSPYKTQFELYCEKTQEVEPENLDEVERVQFGNLMEDVIANEYARRNGVKVRRRNQVLRHAKHPWMLANVDRLVEGQRRGLECKNVDGMAYRKGEVWGEPGTDQIPEPYLLQCVHYMAVTNLDEWHLAACVGGNRLVTYIIRRDAKLEEVIIEGEQAFWQCVEARHAPEPDYAHASTTGLLKRLHPGTDGNEIALGEDIAHWHAVKTEADALAQRYNDASTCARNHILAALGGGAIGRLPDGSAYRRKIVTRKAYCVEEATYVDMRHVKAKE